MHKVANFIQKHTKKPSEGQQENQASSNIQPFANEPGHSRDSFEQDVYRYRKHRGVNLGSWFVLERWIAEAPFRFAQEPGQSDLDVARGAYAKEVLERHWDSWIQEDDWAWIAQHGLNSVRIPIGYYHICGADPSVLPGTDFADFGHVFEGAWSRIVEAIEIAHRYGLGVLIDLHAAPGKQNNDAHAGTSNTPAFFSANTHMQHTIHVLTTLLKHLRDIPRPNIIGVELLNEPAPPNDGALTAWYTRSLRTLRAVDPSMPFYLGDCWRPDHYASFAAGLPQTATGIIAVDHHLYRCFTQEDARTPAREHARLLSDAGHALGQIKGAPIVVGEWSGALNPGSLHGSPNENTDRRAFIDAQLSLYERACAGWFFWTYKKQERGDKGWSLRDAVEAGVFPQWVGLKAKRQPTGDEGRTGRRDNVRDKALGEHTSYWDQHPGNYEHWRFGDGFIAGWDDMYLFLGSGANGSELRPVTELGFVDTWMKKRAAAHAQAKGGKSLWEFEHGFVQGVGAARRDFEENYCE